MKCQILFSRKNKKNIISLPSAKNAQRVVKVKYAKRNYFCSVYGHLDTGNNLCTDLEKL